MQNKKKSVAIERRVQCYPPPVYHKLTVGYAAVNGMTESKVISQALKDFFDRMPQQEKERLLSASKHSYT